MTATTIRVQMAQRKDTAANWTAANPILLSGEIGYEADTKKFKIGNGSSNWNTLTYLPIPDGSGNLTITGNLEIGTTGSLTFEGSTANAFETTMAVTDPTADRTITFPDRSGTVITSGDTGTVTSSMLADGTIVNADISATAEIAVSKLANGTANQVLVTDGTDVTWSDNLTLAGNLTVNGTTTTIDSQTLLVEDKNSEMGVVATPTDVTADGGGITLKGTTDKTINWIDSTDSWTSSEHVDLASGKSYRINNTVVLSSTTLGSGVTSSSLTSVGTLGSLTVSGSATAASFIPSSSTVPTNGVYLPSANTVAISTNGTKRFEIDSSGRLLVGTSTASSAAAQGTPQIQAAGDYQQSAILLRNTTNDNSNPALILQKIRGSSIVQNGDYLGQVNFDGYDGAADRQGATIAAVVDGTPGSGDLPCRLMFGTTADGASSPTERMRISADGLTRTYGDGDSIIAATGQAAGTTFGIFVGRYSATSTTTGTNSFIVYTNGNVVNTNNSYGSISDIKLKENIVDAGSQWADLKALQVRKYNFKEETGQQTHTQIGLIAQEVELVSPGLVSESPDRDTEGNDLGTTTKSVNYSVLYMKAVKALQEAMERIETLEASNTDLLARVSALEST